MPIYFNITFSTGIISMKSSHFYYFSTVINKIIIQNSYLQKVEWIQKVNLMKIKMVEDCFYSVTISVIDIVSMHQD